MAHDAKNDAYDALPIIGVLGCRTPITANVSHASLQRSWRSTRGGILFSPRGGPRPAAGAKTRTSAVEKMGVRQ